MERDRISRRQVMNKYYNASIGVIVSDLFVQETIVEFVSNVPEETRVFDNETTFHVLGIIKIVNKTFCIKSNISHNDPWRSVLLIN